MCQAFEPATSTQDKSLSTVGFPTRTNAARAVLGSFSSLVFFLYYCFCSSCYSDYVIVNFYAGSVLFFFFFFALWLLISFFLLLCVFFVKRLSKGRWILGYLGGHSILSLDPGNLSEIPGIRRILGPETVDRSRFFFFFGFL